MVSRKYKNLILSLMIGVFVGCTKEKTAEKVLKIHFPVYKLVLDPHKMEDLYSMAVITQIFRGLLRYNTKGDVSPDLAVSWTESPDKKIYRFKLQEATFSDGSKITATNVQMSFARIFALGAAIGADIDYIEGAIKFRKSKNLSDLGIKVVDSNVVEFRLEKPSALFLTQLAVTDCAVLPLKKFDDPLNFDSKGSFSGPYKIINESVQTNLIIEKWRSDVMDSKNPPKKVSYIVSDKAPVTLALEGVSDTLDHDKVSPEDKANLQKKGWAAVPTELTGEGFVILNPRLVPQDVRAYLYSITDSKDFVQRLGGKILTPAFGVIPKGLRGEMEENLVLGLKNKKSYTGPKVTVELEYEKTSDIEQRMVDYLKEKWAHPKIDIKIVPLTINEKLRRMFTKKSQAVVGRKSIDYPDGYSVLTYFKGNYESNYFHVNDPEIDEAIFNVIQVFDPKEREGIYKEIQKKILAHHTVIPLFFGSEASGLWSNKVLYVPSHSMGYHTLPVESIEMR